MKKRFLGKTLAIIIAVVTCVVVSTASSFTVYAQSTADSAIVNLQTYVVAGEYQKAAQYLHDLYTNGKINSLGITGNSPIIKDNGDGTGCGLYQGADTFPNGDKVIYFYYGGLIGGLRCGSGEVINWSWDSEGNMEGYYTFEGEFEADLPNGSGTATEVIYNLYTNITTGIYTNGYENGQMVESQIKEVMEEFEYRDLNYTSVDGIRQDKTKEVAEHIYEQMTAYGVQDCCTVEEIETQLRSWSMMQGGYIYMYDPNYTNVCNHGFGLDEDDGPFCNYEWCVWTTDGSKEGVRHIV